MIQIKYCYFPYSIDIFIKGHGGFINAPLFNFVHYANLDFACV